MSAPKDSGYRMVRLGVYYSPEPSGQAKPSLTSFDPRDIRKVSGGGSVRWADHGNAVTIMHGDRSTSLVKGTVASVSDAIDAALAGYST